ncbi:secreted insulinase like peptidase [Cryptosporidium ryanae]|uniref:secreted insulinase like peptidase n=1 Tax=Cryptosporidium ryanae TaxID=515981 RepID=UPI00351A05C6|nr:secreted insulinase like peptidase [Cryptosporidium ryanae]
MTLLNGLIIILIVNIVRVVGAWENVTLKEDLFQEVSEFVSKDTLNYIFSFNPNVLDTVSGINNYSQMRTFYYDINEFKKVQDWEFEKMKDTKGEYRFVTLTNKMKVFIVSKPVLFKSTMTLSVRCGSSHDPSAINGLSHLLKNIILSKLKFKKLKKKNPIFFNNIYNKIRGRVGSMSTKYSLEVFNEDFVDSLYEFSRLLVGNLVIDHHSLVSGISMTRKELNEDILFSDILSLIVSEHFYLLERRFLKKIGSDDPVIDLKRDSATEVMNNYNLLIDGLMKQFETYYSSNLMILSIVSTEKMDRLVKLVETLFGGIRTLDLDMKVIFETSKLKTNPYLNFVNNIVSIRENSGDHYIKLIFPIPFQKNLWRYKITDYISYYLMDESDEGLTGILKSKGWINTLSSECSDNESGYSNFVISVGVTKLGTNHLTQILESIFSTLKLVQKTNITDDVLNLIRFEIIVDLVSTNFGVDVNQADHIIDTYLNTECSPSEVLTAPYTMEKVDRYYINKIIDYIRPDNMVIFNPTKSLQKGASYNFRKSDSFYNTLIQRFESFTKDLYYCISKFFLGFFGRKTKFVFNLKNKNIDYSIEEIPDYIKQRILNINETIATSELNVQLFEPGVENDVLYVDETCPIWPYPISLKDSIERYRMALDDNSLPSNSLSGIEFSKILSLKRMLTNQLDLDSIFYMPLDNKLPIISFTFDIRIPEVVNNSTELLLLNLNRPKLILLSYLFKHALSSSLINTPGENSIKVEDYSDFQNNYVMPGLTIRWAGNSQYFDEFLIAMTHTLSNFRNILTTTHFLEAKKALKKLIDMLNDSNNGDYCNTLIVQILNLESISPLALEDDIKYISFEDVKNFGKLLLKYGEIRGIVIGNLTLIQLISHLNASISQIRPKSRSLNHIELLNSKKVRTLFDLFGNKKISNDNYVYKNYVEHLQQGTLLRQLSNKKRINNVVNITSLPKRYHRRYYFKRRSTSSDQYSSVFLFIYLGSISEKNVCLQDLLMLLDMKRILNSFISKKNNLKYSSINAGPLDISSDVLTFHIKVNFLTSKMIPMVNTLVEFYDTYFNNPVSIFTEKEFLIMKNMLLSNLYIENLDPTRLVKIHYERIIRSNFATNWQQKMISFVQDLTFEKFKDLWNGLKIAPTILIAIQSGRTGDDETQDLHNFVPENYDRLSSIYQFKDSLR